MRPVPRPRAQEEVCGLVLSVTMFHDGDDVTRLTKETRYGLAAGV